MNFKISNTSLSFKTSGDTDIIDITADVARQVGGSGLSNGQVLVFVPGSTAAITTIEYESGVVRDLKKAIERSRPVIFASPGSGDNIGKDGPQVKNIFAFARSC